MLLTAIFAWFHIVSAMMWLGGGILFAFVIGPALARLSPTSSGEFFAKVVPRISMFFRIVAGTTVLFGLLLLYTGESNGDFGALSPSGSWGPAIMIGLSIGLVAFLISEFVAQPPLRKAIRLIKEMQSSSQHQPPAELPKTIRRATITANVTVLLLILALVFMVTAGFY
jgi:uncharacterized membrane protein